MGRNGTRNEVDLILWGSAAVGEETYLRGARTAVELSGEECCAMGNGGGMTMGKNTHGVGNSIYGHLAHRGTAHLERYNVSIVFKSSTTEVFNTILLSYWNVQSRATTIIGSTNRDNDVTTFGN